MYSERMSMNCRKRIYRIEEEIAAETAVDSPPPPREQPTVVDDTATASTSAGPANLPLPLASSSGSQEDVTSIQDASSPSSFFSSVSLRKKLFEGKLEKTVCDDEDNVNISVKESDMLFIINKIMCSVCGDGIELKVKHVRR